MNQNLRSKLKHAKLIIGDIETTSKNFFSQYNPSPIGAIIHDFDFYSSTKIAMSMLKAEYLLLNFKSNNCITLLD